MCCSSTTTELVGLLTEYLEQKGFVVGCTHVCETGVQEALSSRYAFVVLDVMMPHLNG